MSQANILLSSQESHKEIQKNQGLDDTSLPQCRICLQTTSLKVLPCRCRGEAKYIHEQCLCLWIQKCVQNGKISQGSKQSRCQICRGKIIFDYQTSRSCSNWKKLTCSHVCLLVPLLLFMGLLIFFSVLTMKQVLEHGQYYHIITFIILLLIGIIFLGLSFGLFKRSFTETKIRDFKMVERVRKGIKSGGEMQKEKER